MRQDAQRRRSERFYFTKNKQKIHRDVFKLTDTFIGGKKSHLCLREPQRGSQLGSLRQRQVLCVLEAPLQGGQLEAGVDRPGLPHFLRLAVHHPHLRLGYFLF